MLRGRQRLADEILRPVSYADAQSFRWITVLLAWTPFLLATFVGRPPGGWVVADVWLGLAYHLAMLASLAVMTGVPSYLFHPRVLSTAQQNRAIALSYYTAAPLAFTLLVFVIAWIAGPLEHFPSSLVLGLLGLQLAAWWLCLLRLARHVRGERVVAGIAIPLLWIGVGGGTFLLVKWGVIWIALVGFSLME